jgi:hypothetical protein
MDHGAISPEGHAGANGALVSRLGLASGYACPRRPWRGPFTIRHQLFLLEHAEKRGMQHGLRT